jgi:hypothetical protein
MPLDRCEVLSLGRCEGLKEAALHIRFPIILADVYASIGDSRMIITQIGIAMSAGSILLGQLVSRECCVVAGTPAITALTKGPDTG